MNTTNTSGTNHSMHKRENKNRYSNNRNHHRYNGNDSSHDQRVRHSAKQSLEKYLGLAREATVSGDKISAEYYLQYADHFHRVYQGLNYSDEDGERKNTSRYLGNQHRPQRRYNKGGESELPDGEEGAIVQNAPNQEKEIKENPVLPEKNVAESKKVDVPMEPSSQEENRQELKENKKKPQGLRTRRPSKMKKENEEKVSVKTESEENAS